MSPELVSSVLATASTNSFCAHKGRWLPTVLEFLIMTFIDTADLVNLTDSSRQCKRMVEEFLRTTRVIQVNFSAHVAGSTVFIRGHRLIGRWCRLLQTIECTYIDLEKLVQGPQLQKSMASWMRALILNNARSLRSVKWTNNYWSKESMSALSECARLEYLRWPQAAQGSEYIEICLDSIVEKCPAIVDLEGDLHPQSLQSLLQKSTVGCCAVPCCLDMAHLTVLWPAC